MNLFPSSVLVSSLAIMALSAGVTTQAAERQFTYSTQSNVLAPGAKEAEVITTYQLLCNEAGSVYQQVAARELAALDRPLPAADDEGTAWNQRWRAQRLEAMAGELVRRVQQAEGSLGELIGQLTVKEQELARLRTQVSQLESAPTAATDQVDDAAAAGAA